MKAYMVFCFDPMEGCSLVYSKTAKKAKLTGWKAMPIEGEYIDMRATRKPDYDQYYVEGVTPNVAHDNGDLPEGAPLFFSEVEL